MDQKSIARARDEFFEYLALHGHSLILWANLTIDAIYSVGKKGPVLWATVTPSGLTSRAQGAYAEVGIDAVHVLRSKASNLWDDLDMEIAMALKSAIKEFIEAPSRVQQAGISNRYCLGHVIKAGEKFNDPYFIAKDAIASSIIKSLREFDSKKSILGDGAKAILVRKIAKSLEASGFKVNPNWEEQFLPSRLSAIFDVIDEEIDRGVDKKALTKSIRNYMAGKDIDLSAISRGGIQ